VEPQIWLMAPPSRHSDLIRADKTVNDTRMDLLSFKTESDEHAVECVVPSRRQCRAFDRRTLKSTSWYGERQVFSCRVGWLSPFWEDIPRMVTELDAGPAKGLPEGWPAEPLRLIYWLYNHSSSPHRYTLQNMPCIISGLCKSSPFSNSRSSVPLF